MSKGSKLCNVAMPNSHTSRMGRPQKQPYSKQPGKIGKGK